jgi:hypothetical protein
MKSRGAFIYEAMAHLYYDICLMLQQDLSCYFTPFTKFSRRTADKTNAPNSSIPIKGGVFFVPTRHQTSRA